MSEGAGTQWELLSLASLCVVARPNFNNVLLSVSIIFNNPLSSLEEIQLYVKVNIRRNAYDLTD